jgi:uncharacterized protein (TIGR03435 family)
MNRITTAALFAIRFASWHSAQAQPTPAAPALKFEVASLKPSQPGSVGGGIRPAPGGERYLASNMPLKSLIMTAYRLQADQVLGGPAWMDTELYDMNAKAEKPSSIEELHLMLQDLLAVRFQLRFHHETKELPIYALMVDKDGPKLKTHEGQSAADPWIDNTFEQLKMTMHAKFAPMDFFAWRLSMVMDRHVIDRTKLAGGYDFDLTFTREPRPDAALGALIDGAPFDTSTPTIFDAVRQQLGLRLESQKGLVDMLVIDHAEKPGGN